MQNKNIKQAQESEVNLDTRTLLEHMILNTEPEDLPLMVASLVFGWPEERLAKAT